MTDRRLALDLHVLVEPLDVETGLRGVLHARDDHHGNLNGIATLVVHLQFLAGEVPRTERQSELAVERIRPVPAARADRATVRTKQHQHASFVRLQREEAETKENPQPDRQQTTAQQPEVRQTTCLGGAFDRQPKPHFQPDPDRKHGDHCRQHEPAVRNTNLSLARHGCFSCSVGFSAAARSRRVCEALTLSRRSQNPTRAPAHTTRPRRQGRSTQPTTRDPVHITMISFRYDAADLGGRPSVFRRLAIYFHKRGVGERSDVAWSMGRPRGERIWPCEGLAKCWPVESTLNAR